MNTHQKHALKKLQEAQNNLNKHNAKVQAGDMRHEGEAHYWLGALEAWQDIYSALMVNPDAKTMIKQVCLKCGSIVPRNE